MTLIHVANCMWLKSKFFVVLLGILFHDVSSSRLTGCYLSFGASHPDITRV
jgi:hypothetical protein